MTKRSGKRESRKLDQAALWEYALRSLASRAHSAGELRQKLRRRAASAGDVGAVIARLREHGMLDDRQYAEAYAASRRENQGFGKARILRDLRQKRVSSAVAVSAVERVFRGTDETELIEQFLTRKYRKISLPEYLAEPRHLAAAYRRLRSAGFSAGSSLRVLQRYSALAEQLDPVEDDEPQPG